MPGILHNHKQVRIKNRDWAFVLFLIPRKVHSHIVNAPSILLELEKTIKNAQHTLKIVEI